MARTETIPVHGSSGGSGVAPERPAAERAPHEPPPPPLRRRTPMWLGWHPTLRGDIRAQFSAVLFQLIIVRKQVRAAQGASASKPCYVCSMWLHRSACGLACQPVALPAGACFLFSHIKSTCPGLHDSCSLPPCPQSALLIMSVCAAHAHLPCCATCPACAANALLCHPATRCCSGRVQALWRPAWCPRSRWPTSPPSCSSCLCAPSCTGATGKCSWQVQLATAEQLPCCKPEQRPCRPGPHATTAACGPSALS